MRRATFLEILLGTAIPILILSALAFGGSISQPGGGSGTVTSVAQTVPSILAVAGSPITTSGTLAITLATQTANLGFFGPASGVPAPPTFRALVNADIPTTLTPQITALGIGVAAGATDLLINSGTTPTNAVTLDMAALTALGQRDSHFALVTGRAHDGTTAYQTDWRSFVDVTSNAGASTWTLQSRINAAAFTTRMTVDDAGNLVMSGSVSSGDGTYRSGVTNHVMYAAAGASVFVLAAFQSLQLVSGVGRDDTAPAITRDGGVALAFRAHNGSTLVPVRVYELGPNADMNDPVNFRRLAFVPQAGNFLVRTEAGGTGFVANQPRILQLGSGPSNTVADIAGVNAIFHGGQGTGTGAGGAILFQVAAAAGTTGSTVNALATVAQIESTGGVRWLTGTKPTCAAGIRGTVYYVAGAATVLDTFEVCRKDAADVYAWVALF